MKKLITYLPFHFLIAMIIGIVIQFYFKIRFTVFYPIILVLFVMLSCLFFFKKKKTFTICTWILFLFIGISTTFIHNTQNYNNHYSKIKNDTSSYIIKIDKVLKPNKYYQKYEANIIQVDHTETIGKILLNIQKDSVSNNLYIGNKLLVKSKLKNIKPPLNPYEFNYKNYLIKQGITEQIFLTSTEYLALKNSTYTLNDYIASFRLKIQTQLKKHAFLKEELDIINALLLGQKQETSKELLNNYTKAGAIHILAISGLHIGILLLILSRIFKPLDFIKNGSIIKTVVIITFLWLFAMLTGLSASVVRATTMFSFIALGNSLHRKKVIEHSLITSMFFILLVKPLFIFDVGFQLSYLAVFAIIWIQPVLYKVWKPKYKLTNKLWQLITVSLAAQIGVLPITLYYFHQFPSLFMLSNIVIIPLLGMILIGGFIIVILALLNSLPEFLVEIYSYGISSMNSFVQWIALQEGFLFTKISMSLLVMLLLYLLLIAIYQWILKKITQRLFFLLSTIIILQTVFLYEKHQEETKREFIVFHQNKKSIIAKRQGNSLSVYSSLDSISLEDNKALNSYKIRSQSSKRIYAKRKYIYQFNNKNILVVDSLGMYPKKELQNSIVILENNPKINLDRLIQQIQPQQIIVNGTNYKSNVFKWKETCKKQKTPFWHTTQNGAYILR